LIIKPKGTQVIKHTEKLVGLESIHNNPFDRIQLAQAKIEKLTFITRDEKSLQY